MMAPAGERPGAMAVRQENLTVFQHRGLVAINNAQNQPHTHHYYIYEIPWVAACAAVNKALLSCRQAYDDPRLGAIALEIRFNRRHELAADQLEAGLRSRPCADVQPPVLRPVDRTQPFPEMRHRQLSDRHVPCKQSVSDARRRA